MTWATANLYTVDATVNDLTDFEPVLASTADDSEHSRVKAKIGDDLRNRLKHLQERGEDYYGSSFELLDHIENIEVLQVPAVYLALNMIFNGKSVSSQDTYGKKAHMYDKLYPEAFETAVRRLTWDVDTAHRRTGQVRIAR